MSVSPIHCLSMLYCAALCRGRSIGVSFANVTMPFHVCRCAISVRHPRWHFSNFSPRCRLTAGNKQTTINGPFLFAGSEMFVFHVRLVYALLSRNSWFHARKQVVAFVWRSKHSRYVFDWHETNFNLAVCAHRFIYPKGHPREIFVNSIQKIWLLNCAAGDRNSAVAA